MKRLLILFLAAIMCVSIVSCVGGKLAKGDEKIAKAFDIPEGGVRKYECVEEGKIITLTSTHSYVDEETSCVITDYQKLYLKKDGDSYGVTKAVIKQSVSGENADEYKDSLDPVEDADKIKALSGSGLELEGDALGEYGFGSDTSFSLEYDFEKGQLLTIESCSGNYKEGKNFIFDESGKQTSVKCYGNRQTGDYKYTIHFTEYHSNGMLKTAERDFGYGITAIYKYNDKGFFVEGVRK